VTPVKRYIRLFFGRTLAAFLGVIFIGAFVTAWVEVDRVFGGLERVSLIEAKSCLEAIGARQIGVGSRGVVATTDGEKLEGAVSGEVARGETRTGVTILVLEGDRLPPKIPFRYGITDSRKLNALVSWNSKAKKPRSLLACIDGAAET
jgi:heme A synthase